MWSETLYYVKYKFYIWYRAKYLNFKMVYLGSGEDDLPAHKYQENNPENMKTLTNILRTILKQSATADPYLSLTDPDADPRGLKHTDLHGTFTSFFKVKNHKEVTKQFQLVILTNFAWWWKDPDPYLWLADPGGPKTYGSGSATLFII